MLPLHLHQGSDVTGKGDDDDNDLQEGGDGAGKAGGEVVQHPRFKPGDEEPDQEPGRNNQPGRDGRWKHLLGEPD